MITTYEGPYISLCFIDDVRVPPSYKWSRVKSYEDFFHQYQIIAPVHISFDHDLGEDKTGYDIAKQIINLDIEQGGRYIPEHFTFNVHSDDPSYAKNIALLLVNYLEFKDYEKDVWKHVRFTK